jgi:hypothetical protein
LLSSIRQTLAASSTLQRALKCRDSLTDSHSFYGHKLRSQVDATALALKNGQKRFLRSQVDATTPALKNGQKRFVQSIKAEINYFDRVSRINRKLEKPIKTSVPPTLSKCCRGLTGAAVGKWMGYKSALSAPSNALEGIPPTPARLAPGFFSIRGLLVILRVQFLDRDRRRARPRLPQPQPTALLW